MLLSKSTKTMPESSPSAVRTSTHATTPCSAALFPLGRPTLSLRAAAPVESTESDMPTEADDGSVVDEMRRAEGRLADDTGVDEELVVDDEVEVAPTSELDAGRVAVLTMPPGGRATTVLLRRAVGPDGSSGATCVAGAGGGGPTIEGSEARERGTAERRGAEGSCAGASGTS